MCVCFFQRMCATNNMCMCHLWRDIFNGRTHHPHPDAPTPTHSHTPTTTQQHTKPHRHTIPHANLPQPTLVKHGGHTSWRQQGFFRVSYTEGFFSGGNKFFFRGGSPEKMGDAVGIRNHGPCGRGGGRMVKAFEKVQRGAVWKLAMYFHFPPRALRVLCVCVILQDLLTKPVTQQRLDRLRPPLGLVMKTRGNDNENPATWARHLRHFVHLRPVKTCRFGEMCPLMIIAHSLTSAHETVPFLVVRSVTTTLVCSVNRAKLCSVYVPRDDECGWATHMTKCR